MSLKLYFDSISQPSRALYILLKYSKAQFTPVLTKIQKGEHLSEEFEKINRFQKLPVLDHNGFILTESVSIMKYLAREKIIPENLYPSDSKLEARVNEYLAWQHIGIRAPCSIYFIYLMVNPLIFGKVPKPETVMNYQGKMVDALDLFEEKWIGDKKYLVGDSLTVADLLACCEIEQPRIVGYDPKKGRPNIAAWMERVKNDLNPFYEEGHAMLEKAIKSGIGMKYAPKS